MNDQRKKAVALSYDPDREDAPHVSAKGRGEVAEHIIRIAEENDVPIREDGSLVALLAELDVHETIPSDLFEVVAEIFAFIYRLDQSCADK